MEQIKQENLQSSSASQGEVHTKQTKEKKRQEIKMTGKGKALTEKAAEEQKSVSILREEPQRRRTVTFGKNPPHRQLAAEDGAGQQLSEDARGTPGSIPGFGEQRRTGARRIIQNPRPSRADFNHLRSPTQNLSKPS